MKIRGNFWSTSLKTELDIEDAEDLEFQVPSEGSSC